MSIAETKYVGRLRQINRAVRNPSVRVSDRKTAVWLCTGTGDSLHTYVLSY